MFVQSAPTYLHRVILEELETHEDQVDQELLRIFPHVLAEVARKKIKLKKTLTNGDNNFECVRFDEKIKIQENRRSELTKKSSSLPNTKDNFWPFVFIKHVDEVHFYRVSPPSPMSHPVNMKIQGDNLKKRISLVVIEVPQKLLIHPV